MEGVMGNNVQGGNSRIFVKSKPAFAKQLARHRAELKALKAEIRTLHLQIAKEAYEADTPDEADTHTNFVATGPATTGIGFFARAATNAGFKTGVVGIGSSEFVDQIKDTIGVLGYTATLDNNPADGNGRGVAGLASGHFGIGVQGRGLLDATGVQGISEDSAGVQGISDTAIGVEGHGGVGVFGSGTFVGVEGASDTVGVLGGPPIGRVLDGTFGVGVVGVGIGDVRAGDVPFAYGGWFDALNGTAPLHLEPSTAAVPTVAAQRGDFFVDNSGKLWFCTDSGDPAKWKQVQLV
jgi:hypothetical protein